MIVAAIESVFAQTCPVLDVIVVDDGSVDGTADVIRNLIRRTSSGSGRRPKIRYIGQPNMGQSHARNTGIAAARGDWIAFLDSDDRWLPDKIQWQLRAIAQFKSECGVCISDARLVNKAGSLDTSAFQLAGNWCKELIGTFPNATVDIANLCDGCWIQATLVRRDLATRIGGFDADLHFMEDHDFLFRLSLVTCFCYVNLPLVMIDRTSTATDPNARARPWDRLEFRLKAQQYMYEKWLTMDKELPLGVRTVTVRNLRQIHSAWVNVYLKRDQFDSARQALSTAISYQLTSGLAAKWFAIRLVPNLAKKFAPVHHPQS